MSSQTSDFLSVYMDTDGCVHHGKNLRDKLYVKYCMFSCLLCVWNSLLLSGVFNIHGILINILLDIETRLSLVITVDMPDPHNTMPNERILNVNSKIAAAFFYAQSECINILIPLWMYKSEQKQNRSVCNYNILYCLA